MLGDLVEVDYVWSLFSEEWCDLLVVNLEEHVEFSVEFCGSQIWTVWLRKQQPISVFALEDLEIIVEKGNELIELPIVTHLSLSEVSRVNKVIENKFFGFGSVDLATLGEVIQNGLENLCITKARPQNNFKFVEHQ